MSINPENVPQATLAPEHPQYIREIDTFKVQEFQERLQTEQNLVLGIIAGVRRMTPFAIAAALYGLLTITYNYDGVWLHMNHAQRLTVDLFVALALVFMQASSNQAMRVSFVLLWIVSAWHVFFGALDAADARSSLTAWWK